MKRQIKQLHIDSVEAETGEVDTAEEEVVIESPNNVREKLTQQRRRL